MRVTFQLSDNDLKHFRRIMKEVRTRYEKMPEEKIIEAARALLDSVAASKPPDFVTDRVTKLCTLIDMLEDDEWAIGGQDRERVVRGIAYFAEPDDIIPDRVPVLGFLDDAIMIELVVEELVHELDAYRDFCEFRSARDKTARGKEDPTLREEWIVSRRKQLHARIRRRRSRRRGPSSAGGARTGLW